MRPLVSSGAICVVLALAIWGPTAESRGIAEPGGIMGHVMDPTGHPLPGAGIAVMPERGGRVVHTTSGSDGSYRVEGLPEAVYRVDFDLLGFDVMRRNHVAVHAGSVSVGNGTLRVRPLCECLSVAIPAAARKRAGQVIDARGNPLPHARLEMETPSGREVAWADGEGRFTVWAAADDRRRMTASDTGFREVTHVIAGDPSEPILLRLAFAGTVALPDEERFNERCLCEGFFTHPGR